MLLPSSLSYQRSACSAYRWRSSCDPDDKDDGGTKSNEKRYKNIQTDSSQDDAEDRPPIKIPMN